MEYVCDHYPDLLTIVLTGEATLESAIVATKSESVINYLLKPVRTQEFVEAVDQALQKQVERVHRQNLVNAAAQVLNIVQPPKASPETVSTPPADLTASDAPVFPAQYHRILVLGALVRAYEDDGALEQAGYYENRFQRMLMGMKGDLLSPRHEGYPPIVDNFF
jgi:response regulator RpfG family c-di-GMP phosphodiesterase